MTQGRGFVALNGKGERTAFGIWMRDLIRKNGGRAAVAEVTGINTDSLSKWAGGRAIPSKVNIQKLIDANVIEYVSMADLLAHSPWLDQKYRQAKTPKPAAEVAVAHALVLEQPVPAPTNLLDAVMAEPGLTVKQRAQLAGVIAMIVNGVEVQINLSPSSGKGK